MILSKEYIKQIAASFFADKPVKKVWLFGSYARNAASEESDVDFLIDLQKNAGVGWEYYNWKKDLTQLLNKNVDVVSFDGKIVI